LKVQSERSTTVYNVFETSYFTSRFNFQTKVQPVNDRALQATVFVLTAK